MKPIIFVLSLFLASCLNEKNNFGGTKTYIGNSDDGSDEGGGGGYVAPSETLAQNLIASTVTLYRLDGASFNLNGMNISSIVNRATVFPNGMMGPVDLLPDLSPLGTTESGDVVRIEPAVLNSSYMTSLAKAITTQAVSVFAVVKAGSVGEIISFNSYDRSTQSFQIETTGTTISGKFLSSPSDFYLASLPFPATGFAIVGGSFGDEGALDFSVNGVLNKVPVSTGIPGHPFLAPRILSLGPAQLGQWMAYKEIYIFGRTLSRLEQGSLISYLSKKYGIAITLDPLLAVQTGGGGTTPTTDPNFAPALSVIENKCVSCHAAWSGARASYFKNLGLVSKGNPVGSKLYYRTSGSSGEGGPKNMPQSGSISAGEVELIRVWIANMP